MMDEKSLLKQVNASGFPFQLRIEELIRESRDFHDWRVLSSEHPWRSSEARSGYIDLVLEGPLNSYGKRYLIIECKRMGGDGQLVFLKSSPHIQDSSTILLYASHESNSPVWQKVSLFPETFISSFCTVPGQSDKQTPMLERISAELLDSLESLAEADMNFLPKKDNFGTVSRGKAIYIPVIVTNTELSLHMLYPKDVDLLEGKIPEGKGRFSPVPYIRFQKSLFTRFLTTRAPVNLLEANHESQRTVFVVHAPHLPDFLRALNL